MSIFIHFSEKKLFQIDLTNISVIKSKRTFVAVIFSILYPATVFSQSVDSIISNTRIKYSDTRKNISSYDTLFREVWDESTEGGEATAFYDGSNLRLIEVWLLGENFKERSEYYFDKGELLFVFETAFKYNRPFYFDSSMAVEYNDTAYDPAKTSIEENRYYFHNGKLIRWINNNQEAVDPGTENFSEAEKDILLFSGHIKNLFTKQN